MIRQQIAIATVFLLATQVAAQNGSVEYGAAYDDLRTQTDELAKVLSTFSTPDALRTGMPAVKAASLAYLEEICRLEAEGVPVIADEMHPNDYVYTGHDAPSKLAMQQVRIIQMDNDLANQMFSFLDETDCSDI